jgi:hypothetical protein
MVMEFSHEIQIVRSQKPLAKPKSGKEASKNRAPLRKYFLLGENRGG